MLDTLNTTLGILPRVGKKIQCCSKEEVFALYTVYTAFCIGESDVTGKTISRTLQNRYSILETWLKFLLSTRFASVWSIESHFDSD